MSNTLKNKMYNHEVTPPENAWHDIAQILDELSSQKETGEKLMTLEAKPPASSWNIIARALDEEIQEKRIRDQFQDVEVEPPSFTWGKIAKELDEQSKEGFVTKLYEHEVIPADENWQKIASSLDSERTPVIPFSKNYNKIIRIAVAAAVIVFLAWAGYTISNKSANNNLANSDGGLKTPPKTPVVKPIKQPGIVKEKITGAENNDNTIKPAVTPFKKVINPDINEQQPINEIVATDIHTNSDAIGDAETKNLHKKNTIAAASAPDENTETRYLLYLTDQGNIMKLSKKLADFKCIYTKEGDVSQQALAKLDESQCNDQIKYWQERMANSSLQSSSNPLELIEILQ